MKDELKNSQSQSIKKDQNPRDFIICTNLKDYEKLENDCQSLSEFLEIPIWDAT